MRGKVAKKRQIDPDTRYGSVLLSKFVNKVMYSGQKEKARKIVYGAVEYLNKTTKEKGLEAFEKSIENIKPKVEVRSRRVGGANYQVPVPVKDYRQEALAIRWIIKAARGSRKSQDFASQLGQELVAAYNEEGSAFKKKEDTHKMAEANKAFAQFSW